MYLSACSHTACSAQPQGSIVKSPHSDTSHVHQSLPCDSAHCGDSIKRQRPLTRPDEQQSVRLVAQKCPFSTSILLALAVYVLAGIDPPHDTPSGPISKSTHSSNSRPVGEYRGDCLACVTLPPRDSQTRTRALYRAVASACESASFWKLSLEEEAWPKR